ncbi:MAG: hypothetical protein ACREBG_06035 [Pyrinomonadaceae bacterium]
MTTEWSPQDTTTHQDHIIAHIVGSTVLGYFILDEELHVLLDMGFIWNIYLDGEMGLLPHPVAIGELEVEKETCAQIAAETDLLLSSESNLERLALITPAECLIKDVTFFSNDDRRRLVIEGEETSLKIETSLHTAQFQVSEFPNS